MARRQSSSSQGATPGGVTDSWTVLKTSRQIGERVQHPNLGFEVPGTVTCRRMRLHASDGMMAFTRDVALLFCTPLVLQLHLEGPYLLRLCESYTSRWDAGLTTVAS